MIKLYPCKGNNKILFVYCSVVPHDFPPRYRLNFVRELSKFSQVIFIDLPGGFQLLPFRKAAEFYYQLIAALSKYKFSFVWEFFRFRKSHFFIFYLYLLFQKYYFKKRIVLYTTSGYKDYIYRYIPYDKSIFDCPDIHKGELEKNRAWINKFDLIFTNTKLVSQILKKYNDNVKLVAAGYRKKELGHFSMSKIPNSVLFLGGISQRIDYDLLKRIIQKLPKIDFYFIGEVYLNKYYTEAKDNLRLTKWKKLLIYPNVHYLGDFPGITLEFILPFFKIGIIPYETNDIFNYYSNPIKLYDYLACGIYVISTHLPNVARFSKKFPVITVRTLGEFVSKIKLVLHKSDVDIFKYKSKVYKLLQKESLERKASRVFREVSLLYDDKIPKSA